MNITRAEWSERYLKLLRIHLRDCRLGQRGLAGKLGRAALLAGVASRDLALMHEQALLALLQANNPAAPAHGLIKRAGVFFRHALGPFEAERRAGFVTNDELVQHNTTLRFQTAALERGYRRLGREVIRRKTTQEKTESANERYRGLLLESQARQGKLHQLTRQIISMQELERKKISRELHDEVVQSLVAISVELAALSTGPGPPRHTLKRKIAYTRRVVEHSVQAVHRFARDLRPAVLDDLGLIPALHAYSKRVATKERLQIAMTAFGGVEALNISKRTVLFRVAQEALNNVARHARATRVTLSITERANAIVMEIADDGKSIGAPRTLLSKSTKRLGLIEMRERIEMIGGTLAIESCPGRGTTIRTEIPFKPAPIQ